MTLEPPEDSIARARELNAAAGRLIAQGKLRQALDYLNEAIRVAPSYAPSFSYRADVFERLGMLPHSASDRRRAEELAQGGEQPLGEAEITTAANTRRRMAVFSDTWASLASLPKALFSGRLLAVLGLLALGGAVVGVVIVLVSLLGDGNGDGEVLSQVQGSPTPTTGPTPPPTPTPTPTLIATDGSPFTVADAQAAWQDAGMTVTPGGASAGFSGFDLAPVDLRVERGGNSVEVSVLSYSGPGTVGQDWNIVPGEAATPKEGREIPAHVSIWWNQNIVVVVRSSSGGLNSEALDAFLDLNP